MSDNVLLFPVIGRPIPRPVLVKDETPKSSKLNEFLSSMRAFGGTPDRARVAAMARQANILRSWVDDTCSALDVEFAEEQLRAALKSLDLRKPIDPK